MGAVPASRAKAASDRMRPGCDQERTSWAAACGPTPGWSRSCGASLRTSASIWRVSSRSSACSCRCVERSSAERAGCHAALGRGGRRVAWLQGGAAAEPVSAEQLAPQRLRGRHEKVSKTVSGGFVRRRFESPSAQQSQSRNELGASRADDPHLGRTGPSNRAAV